MLLEAPARTQDYPFRPKKRIRHAPHFWMTERDEEVIEAVYRYRVLDRPQIERLFFATRNRTRERLRLLYLHGYLERVTRMVYPGVPSRGPAYRLAARGAKFLSGRTGVSLAEMHYWGKGDDKDSRQTQVGHLFLEHMIAIADIHIAFDQAVRSKLCTIENWRDDMDMRHARDWDSVEIETSPGAKRKRIPVTPDSYFLLATPRSRGHFFVEGDRATETIAAAWKRKILAYKEYMRSGLFHTRYEVMQPQTGFRVLTVTSSWQRAQNLKAAAERYGSPELAQLFLFAPFEDVDAQDVLTAPIWLRGGTTGRQALL